MKKFAAFAVGAAMSFAAYAAPAPSSLPPGPIYLKFSGQEQIAVGGGTTWAGSNEINWGVFTISTMNRGSVAEPNDQLNPSGFPFFVDGLSGGQITGMFYGVEAGDVSATNPFPAKRGFMDLYWRDLNLLAPSSIDTVAPGVRCGFSCANGYTQGDFLARLFFDTGMDTSDPDNTIVGTTVPSSGGFTGQADSYASVDVTAGGLWANQLDSNWFASWQGLRDLRFKNSYNSNTNWNGVSQNGEGLVLGARIDDPGQAYAVPEPGALSLMGLAMVGMGAVLRRRKKEAA